MQTVIAAIDLGPSSKRILYHAAGFARLMACELKVLHVSASSLDSHARVLDFCRREGPYELDLDEQDITVSAGIVSDVILRESRRRDAALIVVGSRGHGRLATLMLGSTSEAVLRGAEVPVLLVPPVDLDIVNITDRPTLTCGPVLAAIDLSERCSHQLTMADAMAWMARQPLLLMTVAPQRLDDHAAGLLLRQRAAQLNGHKPRALIVRRGNVAEQISQCARAEGSGLVVMGLRAHPRSKPGAIASAVLKTNRAFVLAVPGC